MRPSIPPLQAPAPRRPKASVPFQIALDEAAADLPDSSLQLVDAAASSLSDVAGDDSASSEGSLRSQCSAETLEAMASSLHSLSLAPRAPAPTQQAPIPQKAVSPSQADAASPADAAHAQCSGSPTRGRCQGDASPCTCSDRGDLPPHRPAPHRQASGSGADSVAAGCETADSLTEQEPCSSGTTCTPDAAAQQRGGDDSALGAVPGRAAAGSPAGEHESQGGAVSQPAAGMAPVVQAQAAAPPARRGSLAKVQRTCDKCYRITRYPGHNS